MSGRVGDLSPVQKEKLEKFRIVVSDVLQPDHDDYFLLRWLRARNFDITKAEAMLRKNLLWRKQFGADTILNSFQVPELYRNYYPIAMIGFDKEGCAVDLDLHGRADVAGLVKSVKKTDTIKFFVYRCENNLRIMKKQTEKLGRAIETFVYILDMDNFAIAYSVFKPAIEVTRILLSIYEANYPESLKKAFIINVPSVFMTIFSLVKPFLSEETIKKISIHGKDGWKEPLLEMVDADVLPAFLGGTRTDPDGNPMCTSLINPGGPIPTSYYMKNQVSTFLEEDDVKSTTVSRGSCLPVVVHVEEKNSWLQWKFQTDHNDIALGVYYINGKTDEWEELIPCQKYECHLFPETGTYFCEKAGKYVVQFDNSFSWFRKKKLYYRVGVTTPSQGSPV